MARESSSATNLDTTLHALKKKYGQVIQKGSDIIIQDLERASTGSLTLDMETGGGLPYGRIVELFGPESSGKTSIALKVVANVQKEGKKAVFIDPMWAKTLGVDVDELYVVKPESAEQAGNILEAFVRSGECGIVVLDSLDAMVPSVELEKNLEEDPERVGERAKLISRILRKITNFLKTFDEGGVWNDCLVLLINQTREKIGVMYGSPETTPGGKAPRFYSSIRLRVARGKYIEGTGNSGEKVNIGHYIRFDTVKNKTFSPKRVGEIPFYFDGELRGTFDLAEEVMRYGVLYNVITKAGNTYIYGDLKAVGKQNFSLLLRQDSDLLEKIKLEILTVSRRAPKL